MALRLPAIGLLKRDISNLYFMLAILGSALGAYAVEQTAVLCLNQRGTPGFDTHDALIKAQHQRRRKCVPDCKRKQPTRLS